MAPGSMRRHPCHQPSAVEAGRTVGHSSRRRDEDAVRAAGEWWSRLEELNLCRSGGRLPKTAKANIPLILLVADVPERVLRQGAPGLTGVHDNDGEGNGSGGRHEQDGSALIPTWYAMRRVCRSNS